MLTPQIPKPPCHADDLRAGKLDALTCYSYRYVNLLTRYAVYITKDHFAAAELAAASLHRLWDHRQHMFTDRAVHNFLRTNCYVLCCLWLHEQLVLRGIIHAPPTWKPRFAKQKAPPSKLNKEKPT